MRQLLQIFRLLCLVLALSTVAVAVVWRHFPTILAQIDDSGAEFYTDDASARTQAARDLAETDPEAALAALEALCSDLSSYQKNDRLFAARQHAVRVLVGIALRADQPERAARALLAVLEDYPKDLPFALAANRYLLQVGREETTAEGRQGLQELFDGLPTVSGIARAHAAQLAEQGRRAELADALRAHLAHVDHPIEAMQNLTVPWRISWAADVSVPLGRTSPVTPRADDRQITIPFRVPKDRSVLRIELPTYCIAELTDIKLKLSDGQRHFSFSLHDLQTAPTGLFHGDGSSLSCDGPSAVRFSLQLPEDLTTTIVNGQLVADVTRLPRWLSAHLSGPVGRVLSQEAMETGDTKRYALIRHEWSLARSAEPLVLSGPGDDQTFDLTPAGDQLTFDCQWNATEPCDRIRLTIPARAGDMIAIDGCTISTTAGQFTALPSDPSSAIQWHGVTNDGSLATVTDDDPSLLWTPGHPGERLLGLSIKGSLR